MFVLHRGLGLAAVAGAGIVSALIMNAVARGLFDRRYYDEHLWPKFGALWLAGLMCLIAGAYLRSYTPRLQDRSWYENEAAHHVFFIPVTVWGAIYFVAGVAYLIYAWR
jgi:hypothetical protein